MDKKSIQERVFEWLCISNGLKEVKKQCLEHLQDYPKGKLVYRFVLPINLTELIDFDAFLGNLALHSPLKLGSLLQEVCYITINTLNWIPEVTSSAQVLVVLRFSSVPQLSEYTSSDRGSLMNSTRIHTGTFSIVGVLCSMTGVTQYTVVQGAGCIWSGGRLASPLNPSGQSARFYCPIRTCFGSSRCCYIRVHLSGSTEALTTGKIFACKYCGRTLEEDATCRTLSDKCIIHVISPESLTSKTWIDNHESWNRHQAVPIYVRDEMTKQLELGGLYRITVFHFLDGCKESDDVSSSTPVFEANNLEKITIPPARPKYLHLSLPDSIITLHEDRKSSPWSFASSIAYCFGMPIAHPGSFLHLKMGLLMSLVLAEQIDNENIRGMDIMVLSHDLLTIQRLLMYGASFARRVVIQPSVCDLVASVTRDPSGTGTFLISAGCMLLASYGLCLMTNLHALRKEQKEKLRRVMENRGETIEIPKKFTDCTQHIRVPTKTTVWGCSEPLKSAPRYGVKEIWDQPLTLEPKQSAGTAIQALTNRFALVFSVSDGEDENQDYNDKLALQRAVDDDDDDSEESSGYISEDDIKQFLQFASQRPIKFGESPQKLIQGFYLAGRRARNSQGDFPLSSLQTITSMAAAHARLSLRDQVIDEDVVVAILMFDNSLHISHGYSLLGLQQDFLNPQSIMSVENDLKMKEFQKILYNFCSNYKSYSSPFTGNRREE